eukprot:403374256
MENYNQSQYSQENQDYNSQYEDNNGGVQSVTGGQSTTSNNGELWKKFGRENDVGKMLYSMYSVKEKPKVHYPPVKTKPRPIEQPKEEKKCPQKAAIEYPEIKSNRPRKKYHPIDFVPKRKGVDEIQYEMQQEYNKPLVAPGKRGVDRKELINDLQERFQFKDKAEIDKIMAQKKLESMLPEINPPGKRKAKRYNLGMAQKALQHYQEKYGKPPGDILNLRPKTHDEIRNDQDDELEELFDSVIEEIEERQEYLEEVMKMGGRKDIEARTKNEIVDRIAELQKIREIQNKKR